MSTILVQAGPGSVGASKNTNCSVMMHAGKLSNAAERETTPRTQGRRNLQPKWMGGWVGGWLGGWVK